MEENTSQNKGIFNEGNYVLIVRRGNAITDIWKLVGATVRFNQTTQGWVVVSESHPTFFVAGDVEIWSIRDENADVWHRYQEYHQVNSEPFLTPAPAEEEEAPAPPPKKKWWRTFPVSVQSPVKWNW